ncbi:extracellular solute-binding protein [Amorphus orientalis]|uniref:Microcin C transport system substrate-binding protein n=1 Tax=Amorphus orientalis TaxID=649198 RepID=A0AAE4ARJ0_9HYPH|nr:extracellular solute-binding protein [Amorphus orientalis]MDQ0315221.1 microcin C transport system substrate-binding protein [Amorphus orientalis]
MSVRRSLPVSRRGALKIGALGAFAFGASALPFRLAAAQQASAPAGGAGRHGLSVFGDLALPPDFSQFPYVDPDAPKGGTLRILPSQWGFNQNPLTYNTFNTFILAGDAPPMMEMCFDTLMVRQLDEPDAVYGLVADTVSVSDDEKTFSFHLRPEARFHDGSPLTAEDVAFSLQTLRDEGHPSLRQVLSWMERAEVEDAETVVVVLKPEASNRLPPTIATMPILSKAYYTENDFQRSSLEPPLSSGPYRVGEHETGRYVNYERVADWWAADLPVSRGQHNFDIVRVEFFRDRQIAFQALTNGTLTFREESISKNWVTAYDFPAVRDGEVIKNEFPDNRPSGAQGWFINTRRKKFADPRTRQALGLAFDFQWTNENLFYGLYERVASFFENSDMMAEGMPSEAELALMEPLRDQIPEAAFGEAWTPPVSDGSGSDRTLLREANDLLMQAGWQRDGRNLVDADGNPFTIELLGNSPSFERIVQPYARNLERLGIQMNFRLVDPAQFQSRLNGFDFDMVGRRFALSATPGEGIREFWTSEAADTDGSSNLSGIRNPAIDALVAKLVNAPTREDMVTAARALDRVLRVGFYWVPNWYSATHRVAYWDLFGYPEKTPHYAFPVAATWWWDADKAAALGRDG